MLPQMPNIPDFENILSPEDKAQLRAIADQIPTIRRNIQKAQRAGLNVDEASKQLEDTEKRIQRLLAEL